MSKVVKAAEAVFAYFVSHPKSRAEVVAIASAVVAAVTAAWK